MGDCVFGNDEKEFHNTVWFGPKSVNKNMHRTPLLLTHRLLDETKSIPEFYKIRTGDKPGI
ncbi:MAG: hypothetical protein DRP64_06035 [Verrucomicrobia bacterium]|nr:MAG: hypothetical protein DRP64_06035 [Verrucomicrobiota bacterium]